MPVQHSPNKNEKSSGYQSILDISAGSSTDDISSNDFTKTLVPQKPIPKLLDFTLANDTFEEPVEMAQPNYDLRPKDVVGSVPTFSGDSGVTFRQFSRACKEAKGLLPAGAEASLTKLIRGRLTGGAFQLISGIPTVTIDALLDLLKTIYAPKEYTSAMKREMSELCQGTGESVASYLARSKELGTRIVEISRQDEDVIAEIEEELTHCFTLGLKPEIYAKMQKKNYLG